MSQLVFTPKLDCQLAVLIASVEWLTVVKKNAFVNASTLNLLIVKNVSSMNVNQLSSRAVVSPKVTFHQLKSLRKRKFWKFLLTWKPYQVNMSTIWNLSLKMENVLMMTKKTSKLNGILSTRLCNNVDILVP